MASSTLYSQKKLEQILCRYIRGYAFTSYPTKEFDSAAAYRAFYKKQLQQDNCTLSKEDFLKKYGHCL